MIVYKYDTQTSEFLEELEINEVYGTNLPFTTTVKPLAKKEGFAVCFNGIKWEYVEDNRNTVVYNKETKQESKISYLGALKDGFTEIAPGEFDEWIDGEWIEDTDKKLEHEKAISKSKAKAEGEIYTLNGVDYQVPFMKDDADGLLQVKEAFNLGINETVIHFTNGTKMPIVADEFMDFAVWFVEKRNSFFVE